MLLTPASRPCKKLKFWSGAVPHPRAAPPPPPFPTWPLSPDPISAPGPPDRNEPCNRKPRWRKERKAAAARQVTEPRFVPPRPKPHPPASASAGLSDAAEWLAQRDRGVAQILRRIAAVIDVPVEERATGMPEIHLIV